MQVYCLPVQEEAAPSPPQELRKARAGGLICQARGCAGLALAGSQQTQWLAHTATGLRCGLRQALPSRGLSIPSCQPKRLSDPGTPSHSALLLPQPPDSTILPLKGKKYIYEARNPNNRGSNMGSQGSPTPGHTRVGNACRPG